MEKKIFLVLLVLLNLTCNNRKVNLNQKKETLEFFNQVKSLNLDIIKCGTFLPVNSKRGDYDGAYFIQIYKECNIKNKPKIATIKYNTNGSFRILSNGTSRINDSTELLKNFYTANLESISYLSKDKIVVNSKSKIQLIKSCNLKGNKKYIELSDCWYTPMF